LGGHGGSELPPHGSMTAATPGTTEESHDAPH
jgi:hypothetical protein